MDDRERRPLVRRDVLRLTGAVAGGMAVSHIARAEQTSRPAVGKKPDKPTPCLFTKPLHNRPVAELPALLAELGIDAVDLTCRPQGHVPPERVADDLPRAFELLKAAGVVAPMITTDITDAREGNAEAIIKTAAGLGIRHAKLGYYAYGDLHKIHERLAEVKAKLRDVVAMCRQYGVRAGFHNHAGNTVGAAMWDVWQLIHDLPAEAIGAYFDLRHATVEGGDNGWRIGLHLLGPRIVIVGAKDFVWRRDDKRGWRAEDVPLGEGMVRGEEAFRQLKSFGFAGLISLHVEYGERMPAVDSEADKVNLAAIRKDWRSLRGLLQTAGMG